MIYLLLLCVQKEQGNLKIYRPSGLSIRLATAAIEVVQSEARAVAGTQASLRRYIQSLERGLLTVHAILSNGRQILLVPGVQCHGPTLSA